MGYDTAMTVYKRKSEYVIIENVIIQIIYNILNYNIFAPAPTVTKFSQL